jgi:hypothetical protein
MTNPTLLMIGILAAVAMLSAGLVAVPTTIQQASATMGPPGGDEENEIENDFDIDLEQKNKRCIFCSNDASLTIDNSIGPGP